MMTAHRRYGDAAGSASPGIGSPGIGIPGIGIPGIGSTYVTTPGVANSGPRAASAAPAKPGAARPPAAGLGAATPNTPGPSVAAFAVIAEHVKIRSGLSLAPDQGYMLTSRLDRILRAEGLVSLDSLAQRLSGSPGDARVAALTDRVAEALTTNESFFFRDGKPFAHLRQAMPRIAAARPPGSPLRLWSAGCATGQEAYSMAMVLQDWAGPIAPTPAGDILGTDIAGRVVRRAEQGLYTAFEVRRGLPPTLLARHFRPDGGQWRVQPGLRAMVRFSRANLLDPHWPAGPFDVIFCRNVLIYFDAPTKSRVLTTLAARLAPDGLLYLGGAETLLGLTDALRPMPGEPGVFRRHPAPPA